jgi:hypothetical protein
VFRKFSLTLVLLALAAMPLIASAQSGNAVEGALEWLRLQQQNDGGFSSGFAPGSDLSTTADAVVAVASGGQDPATWIVEGHSPLDYLTERVTAGEAAAPGQTAKVILAALAAGADARDFGGVDLVAALSGSFDTPTAYFGGGPFDSALSILALAGAGAPVPEAAIAGLVASRLDDGSYSFIGDMTPGAGDSNTTALVVQALVATGRSSEIGPSLAYFRASQNPDGGWTYQKPSPYGEATDANSTALVIQALLAAGEDLAAWGNPQETLASLQVSSGAFMFSAATPSENVMATIPAVPALAGVDFTEIASLPEARRAGLGLASPLAGILAAATGTILVILLVAAAVIARRRR